MLTTRRLAVWGDPIAHSRSPQLHTAAYAVLGYDWTYERRRVAEEEFEAAIADLDASWLGLSLTMPLKGAAFRRAVRRDRHAELTGAVNTYLLTADGPAGFNTDVGGIVGALTETGHGGIESARIIGTGATATSALVALHELGVARIDVTARRPEAVARLADLGERLGLVVTASDFAADAYASVPLTIATLPGDADLPEEITDSLATAGGSLFDVVYGTWPTVLGAAWERAGLPAASGLGMLLHQAVRQIRIFANGTPDAPVADEEAVLAVMRRALMGE